ncbi:MAG: hypothetical protein M3367_07655 [Acidobacteriota bacterium]|nr:hypothetical protein [Acidobacteriota bacterium]
MKTNSVEIETMPAASNAAEESVSARFVVFVAGGRRPITSFENFARAERLALVIAGLACVRMEVFDSAKEICYFVEPSEAKGSLIH